MSADNATPDGVGGPTEPSGYGILDGYPDVRVVAFRIRCADTHYLHYSGWPEDLIALGVMQASWATYDRLKLPRDPDGGKVSVARRWRVDAQGQPRRYCDVRRRDCSSDQMAQWPGAEAACEAYAKYTAWRDQKIATYHAKRAAVASEIEDALASRQASGARPRPVLRMVVNNT